MKLKNSREIWKFLIGAYFKVLWAGFIYIICRTVLLMLNEHAVFYEFADENLVEIFAGAIFYGPLLAAVLNLFNPKSSKFRIVIVIAFYTLNYIGCLQMSNDALAILAHQRGKKFVCGKYAVKAEFHIDNTVSLYKSKVIFPGLVATEFTCLERGFDDVQFSADDEKDILVKLASKDINQIGDKEITVTRW